jgi:hypothetical protein
LTLLIMSSSYAVNYGGQRKVVRVSPSSLLLHVLQEACSHFSLDSAKFLLKHKRTTLDLSLPVRLAGLANNAQLDLTATALCPVAGAPLPPVKVALSTVTGTAIHTFGVDTTLRDLLQHHVNAGALPATLWEQSPEVVVLGASFAGPKLGECSLRSLGLSGQSVRFLLRLTAVERPAAVLSVSAHSAAPALVAPSVLVESAAQTLSDSPSGAASPLLTPTASSPFLAAPDSLIVENCESTRLAMAETFTATATAESSTVLAAEAVQTLSISASTSTAIVVDRQEPVDAVVNDEEDHDDDGHNRSLSPQDAIHLFLSSNFDAASRAAVVVMYKYLANIVSQPLQTKFRVVNLRNKVFAEKVAEPLVKHAFDFFFAVGFVLDREQEQLAYLLEDLDGLEAGLIALQWAIEELQIDEQDRPKPPSRLAVSPVVEFDPFKSLVMRNAVQVSVSTVHTAIASAVIG